MQAKTVLNSKFLGHGVGGNLRMGNADYGRFLSAWLHYLHESLVKFQCTVMAHRF